MNKCVFVTFANTSYISTDRIMEQAKSLNIFDNVISKTEHDIATFVEKHKSFIQNNKQGYGLWIWKPKVILDTLNEINENDVLVYADSGMYININGKKRLNEYLNILQTKELITFSTNDYKARGYVKNDAIMSYNPYFNNDLTNSCYAGIMIVKKTKRTIQLIQDWLDLCENYHFIDRSPSSEFRDLPHYDGNDCDSGLFNLCLSKYKDINNSIYPDETNVYYNGKQIAHTNAHLNFDSLYDKPFQCRRLSPRYIG